ncbi:STAS domain-containing protein [Amycolatopsis sp. CA-128772]|uniref:STAS domain-containing protein n=1 Tax=Amycolatopsis sp. CA-128772 TaxID=2073159 RepID=UPI001E4CAC4C|nr:STAS domain-containing protein [Amycolatopsis sp. CA-128772]
MRTRVTVTAGPGHTAVTVTGDLDLAVTASLHEQLEAELRGTPAALVLDLTGVTFCSAGALAVLLDVVTTAHARGIPCAIVATDRAVLRPVRVLQLDRVLPLHRDRAEAEDWLSLVRRLR